MIIKSESYFRKPPRILPPRQVVIFDAIRYSIDICDVTFERLRCNLYEFSFNNLHGEHVHPMIFADVWMIIDSATIFVKVVSRLLNIELNDPIFNKIRDVIIFRHSNQHLDERIEEAIYEKQLPIYGSLSWYAKQDLLFKESSLFCIHSGTISNKARIKSNLANPPSWKSPERVNQIQFTSVVKRNGVFEEQEVMVNKIIESLTEIIEHLELQLDEQLKPHEPTERHHTDLVISVQVKPISPAQ